jgi:hypothetical protein
MLHEIDVRNTANLGCIHEMYACAYVRVVHMIDVRSASYTHWKHAECVVHDFIAFLHV